MGKRKKPVFLVCYLIFLAACIAVWTYVYFYVDKCLVRYEAAQPERLAEKLADSLKLDGFGSVFSLSAAPTRFETEETLYAHYDGEIREKEITWQQSRVNYSPHFPSYDFYAEDKLLGSVTLEAVSTETLMSILSVSQWAVKEAEPVTIEALESLAVTVPQGFSVSVNGIALGTRELTGTAFVPEIFQYAQEYVAVPEMVEYSVSGLYEKPTVEIADAAGTPVKYRESYDNGRTVVTADFIPALEMDSELEGMVLENAERYSNFFSADLPGCQESTKPIADMFPKDSYYLGLADNYRRQDMWMYSAHYAPVFENEKVSEYIRYSDDLFSCVVYFEKNMLLIKTGQDTKDVTHTRFFYGLLDGSWRIVDMQTLLE